MAEETQKPEAAAAAATAEEVVVVEEKPAEVPAVDVEDKKADDEVEEEKPKTEEKEETKITESDKEETNVVGELPKSQKKALDDLKLLIQEALNKHEFTAPPIKEKEKENPVVDVVAETEEKKEEKEEEDKPSASAETEEQQSTEVKVETEAPAAVEVKEEEKTPPPPAEETAAETVVETKDVDEKVTAVDEDGAKTVEAIEESVISVTTPPAAAAAEKQETEEPKEAEVPPPPPPPEEVSIWGIPLLADERSDVILLKFLRARDFKVKDAFTMLKNTIRWRKEFGIESLLDEDLGNEFEKVVFMHGVDKEGHPVCYNVYGEFQNKELYQNFFGDKEKRAKFLRWRVQYLEKSVRKLDFTPNGINTIVQVNDLKNSPWFQKKELRQDSDQALNLLQDNYPEILAKQVLLLLYILILDHLFFLGPKL